MIVPEKRRELVERGWAYGEQRVASGVAYPSDEEAGHIGAAVMVALTTGVVLGQAVAWQPVPSSVSAAQTVPLPAYSTPPVVVPTAQPIAPPPVPVAADAPGAVSAVAGGRRVTFGADRTDLNPATESALREFARSVKEGEAAVNVNAFAAGGPEDPSTPRRLSLARALAARAVLISEGIPSARIYVRALGAAGGDGPADRVDVTATARPGVP